MDLRATVRRAMAGLCDRLSDTTVERDPIDHPDIRRMGLAQLADLPFESYVRVEDQAGGLRDRAMRSAAVRRARSCSLPSIDTVPAIACNAISSRTICSGSPF